MTIKCDSWIRKMATDHNMIVPFESNQVKNLKEKKLFLSEHHMVMMLDVQVNLKFLQTLTVSQLIQKILILTLLLIFVEMTA